jgi:phenylacetate-CoA ligase
MDRRLFLDAAHITEQKLVSFNNELKSFRPKIIVAYARSMVALARYIRDHAMSAYHPQAIITSAEVLEPDDRILVEQVFGCRVFNRYGSREVNVLASECDQHDGLHIMGEGLLIEVVRQDGSMAAAGEQGAILVTDLLNYAMPLIRYKIGDVGAWASGPCKCGRGLPRLESVSGRVTDFLVGCDGGIVSGVFLATYVLAKRPSLGQVQILQNQRKKVTYRICRGPGFDEAQDTDYLKQMSKRYLGEDIAVDFEFVNEILPESSGKFILSRSSIAADFV